MSVTVAESALHVPHGRIDHSRGTHAMAWFIATEAMLFVMLFFSYFYLRHFTPNFAHTPPKLPLAFTMLAVLVFSSVVLHRGELAVRRGAERAGRRALALTIALGVVFLVIQTFEYRARFKEIQYSTDAYGSVFFTITSFHAAHLILGLLMLAYVLVLPRIGANEKPPHHPMKNAAMYWHFVDLVWVVIVAALYVMPNL